MSFTIGGLIYIGYRPESLLMFKWFSLLHLDNIIHFIRSGVSGIAAPLWVIYSLPFALWVAAYQFSTAYVWHNNSSAWRAFWMLSVPVASVLSEVLQFIKIIPGTFDLMDVIFISALATVIYFPANKQQIQ